MYVTESIKSGVKFIEENIEKYEGVVVNCAMGVSRSATIVIAFLMKKTGLCYDEVFEIVKQKRRIIYPSEFFRNILKNI